MQTVNVTQSQSSTLYRTSSNQSKDRSVPPSMASNASKINSSTQVTFSQKALAAASSADSSGPAKKIDFSHMSQSELQVAAKQLFEEGRVSQYDMAVFQRFGRVVGKAGPDGGFAELSPAEREAADSAPKNFVAMLKEQLEIKRASPEALAFYKRMDAALSKFIASQDRSGTS